MEGGCFCGFVRYRVGGTPSDETFCHCSICRRTSGAPVVAWFTARDTDYELLAGEPATFRSSEHGTRSFCPRCGTQLTFQSNDCPDEVDVTVGSLEDPNRVPPKDHTHTSSKLSWVTLEDGLPAFPKARR